jgi:hypothetical protein
MVLVSVHEFPLGRLAPKDYDHVSRYSAANLDLPTVPPTPVIFGINWHTNFDKPVKDDKSGLYWIGRSKQLGTVRGGHAIGALYKGQVLPPKFVDLFNQGDTPRCVGFSITKQLSAARGKVFDPGVCYTEAQQLDSEPGPPPPYDGTEVRAGFMAEQKFGPTLAKVQSLDDRVVGKSQPVGHPELGVDSYYWCTTVEQIRTVLGLTGTDPIVLSNTWGHAYPDVCIPDEVVAKLLKEGGEAGFWMLRKAA